MQRQVIRHVGKCARPRLARRQVLVGHKGIRHQQIVPGLALQHVGAVIADEQIVAAIAAQSVAVRPAKNVMKATNDDVAGIGGTKGAG